MTENKPKLTKAQRKLLKFLDEHNETGASLSNRTGLYLNNPIVSKAACKPLEKRGLVRIGIVTAWITPAGREALK